MDTMPLFRPKNVTESAVRNEADAKFPKILVSRRRERVKSPQQFPTRNGYEIFRCMSAQPHAAFRANWLSRHLLIRLAVAQLIFMIPTLQAEGLPDLAPISFKPPTVVTGQPLPTITVVWGVTNRGNGT